MLNLRFFLSMIPVCMLVLGADVVAGQQYPYKPIRIITSSPGGGNDFSARIVAQGISGPLGQPVIVDYRGVVTNITATVTNSQPDGYTLLVPGLPTVAASGLPGYEIVGMTGIWAPAKTPVPIINRLNREIVRVLNLPDVKERYFNAGVEVVASSPEQFKATIKSDIASMGKVIKEAGIRVD